MTLPSAGKDKEKLTLLYTVGGNIKWYSHWGNSLSYNLAITLLGIYPRKKVVSTQKLVHNCSKAQSGKTKLSFSGEPPGTSILGNTASAIQKELLIHATGWISEEFYAERKEPASKGYLMHKFIYMTLEKTKLV